MRINGDRLTSTLGNLTAARSAAPRDYFTQWAQESARSRGCTVASDAAGNFFVTRAGADDALPPVLIAGRLDMDEQLGGAYGLAAGLEVLSTLSEHDFVTRRSLVVAGWTTSDARPAPAEAGLFRAVFEAQVEQEPLLETATVLIGAVTGTQGAYCLDVALQGVACHAGLTPMEMRRDPWRAATAVIEGAFSIAERAGREGRATIGDVKVTPGSRHTVPESLLISVDLRHADQQVLDFMVSSLRGLVELTAARHGVAAGMEEILNVPAVVFDPHLLEGIRDAAQALGYSCQRMVGGAEHDSLLAGFGVPTAMIVVPRPSADAGANVLLHATVAAAND
jgi:beta-ureidopropionase / N-carbamoyl-L-amino-acid hydrolase